MSTHFRPRPPTAPSSPVRPSTAHSTIRAVTPSPPDSLQRAFALGLADASPLPRSMSEHALGSKEMANFARYVLKAEGDGFGSPKVLSRSSPVKARSRSPKKRTFSTPDRLAESQETPGKLQDHVADEKSQPETETGQLQTEADDQDDNDHAEPPYTPTPIPRSQRHLAYTPLGAPNRTPPSQSLSESRPTSPNLTPPQAHAHYAPQPLSRKPLSSTINSRISASGHSNINNRISVSGHSNITALSTASRNSVFSTPGRDELERKKALVEPDQGPFARVTSMADLDEERRRISGLKGIEKDEKEGRRRMRICRVGCCVM
jgi:hypothetical protein